MFQQDAKSRVVDLPPVQTNPKVGEQVSPIAAETPMSNFSMSGPSFSFASEGSSSDADGRSVGIVTSGSLLFDMHSVGTCKRGHKRGKGGGGALGDDK